MNQTFVPSPIDVDFASRVVEKFERVSKEGKGTFVLDGKVVDMPGK